MQEQAIIARMERLPSSAWHVKIRILFGIATFFDSFDAVALAFTLPVLIRSWHIAPGQIGGLLSISYVGQMAGALFFGWLADRIGRVKAARITMVIFGVMSIVCAFAHDYDQLFWFRLIQGIGLGGEVPIAAAYIAEIAPSKNRGRFFLAYELLFVLGITGAAALGAWIVPRFGWQWLFIIGGIPPLIVAAWQQICPESPRWLASQGRNDEADTVLTYIERQVSQNGTRPLPPVAESVPRPASLPSRWQELFQGRYLSRTLVVWVIWGACYLITNGLFNWLPTLFTTVYKLSLQTSLTFSVLPTVLALFASIICVFAIDKIGRKPLIGFSFVLAAISLVVIAAMGAHDVIGVFILTSIVRFFMAGVAFSVYLYTPELYPTRMRALGTSWASFWLRAGSIVGPLLIGYIIPRYGIGAVFSAFAIIALLGGAACLAAVETRGTILEEISP